MKDRTDGGRTGLRLATQMVHGGGARTPFGENVRSADPVLRLCL